MAEKESSAAVLSADCRLALDSLASNIVIVDGQGDIVYANAAWKQFAAANAAPENVVEGCNYLRVCESTQGPEAAMATKFAAGLREVLAQTRESFEMEYPCHSPHERRWFTSRVILFFPEKSWALISHDQITERKRAEEELITRSYEYEELFESFQDGVFLHALPNGAFPDFFVHVNRRASEQLGYSKEELRQLSLNEVDPLVTLENLETIVHQVRRENRVTFESEHTRKDGTRLPVEVTSTIVRFRGQEMFLSAVRDITPRKEAERIRLEAQQAVEATHEEQQAILNGLQGVVVEYIDSQMRLIWTNDPRFGTDIRIQDQKCYELRYQKGNVCEYCPAVAAIEAKIPQEVETDACPDGRVRYIRSNPVFTPGGDVRGVVNIIWDLTERKEMERELLEAKEAAEALSISKSMFLARMSHEIRTPMNSIIGMGHLLHQTELEGKQREYIQHINSSANMLLSLINDILDFSKYEAGKMQLEKRSFHLEEVLERLSSTLKLKAEEKGVELLFSVAPEVPQHLVGDALRLEQALLNLLSNAVKFTEHGEVILSVRVQQTDAEHLQLAFAVQDTGIGIDPEYIPHLFTPFTQADGGFTRSYGGTGLGLAICKHIARAMGGAIDCQSTPGEGSRFTLTGWLQKGSATPTISHTLRQSLQGKRVLIVEDNPAARQILADNLAHTEMDIVLSGTGENAIEHYRKAQQQSRPFDYVLVDWNLPGINGDLVVEQIRAQSKGAFPKIIMLTAYGRHELIQQATFAGVDLILDKPVMQSSLIDSLITVSKGDFTGESQLPGEHCAWDPDYSSNVAGLHVLLVEDVAANRQVAREILASVGVEVTEAENGAQALDVLRQQGLEGFDVVLMDIQMPVMDGLEATSTIRAWEVQRLQQLAEQGQPQGPLFALPIVALTAHAMAEERERSLEAGMMDHVTKPIDPALLIQTLARWTGRKESQAQKFAPAQAAPESDWPAVPGIDVNAGLHRVVGQQRVYLDMLTAFEESSETEFAALQQAMQEGQCTAAREKAHALKGRVGNLGMVDLHQGLAQLEEALQHSPEAGTSALLEAVRHELNRVQHSVGELLRQQAMTQPGEAEHRDVDKAQLHADIQECLAALEKFDWHAVAVFERIQADLETLFAPQRVKDIEKFVKGYDFMQAQNAMQNILSDLQS